MQDMTPLLTTTRIAPTPSGYLHLGNLASFLYTQGLARLFDARLILRIDDLDKDRFRSEYVQDILDTLDFAGINCNQEERTHRTRLKLYADALDHLRKKGLVYACSCTRKRSDNEATNCSCMERNLSLDQPGIQWRLLPFAPEYIEIIDIKSGRQVHPFPSEMNALQVRKKNGDPSYHLASVVDDCHFGITLIVRGMDLLPSSLAQIHLADLLGETNFRTCVFDHHPLIVDKENQKMSKSANSTSIHWMRQQRIGIEEICNRIANHVELGEPVQSFRALEKALVQLWYAQ